MAQKSSDTFKIMTDEHIANAVAEQLQQKGIDAIRLIDALPAGTPDPDVLAYCHEHGYTLVTLDERMPGHIEKRTDEGLEYAGVFIGTRKLQRPQGIGVIVNFIIFYDEAIQSGAATLEDDVYNKTIYMD